MAFTPSAQQLEDLKKINEQRALGNYAYGGNIGASNPGATPFNLSKTQEYSPAPLTGSSGSNLQDRSSNPGSGYFWDAASGWKQVMEGEPSQPSVDWNAIYQPAFDALNQQEQSLKSQLPETEQGILSQAETSKSGLKTEESSRLANYASQEQRETGKAQTTEQDTRRQTSELMRGLQAAYGGTTGTGAFAGEILGAQATRNIAQNRLALRSTIQEINNARDNLKNTVFIESQKIDNQAQSLIQEARRNLQTLLAQIATSRGQLEVDKGRARMDALQRYQEQVQAVKARNAAFKQQLYIQQTEFEQGLEKLQSKAVSNYQASLSPSQLSTLFRSGAVTEQGIPYFENQLGLAQGTLQLPNKKEDDSELGVPKSTLSSRLSEI